MGTFRTLRDNLQSIISDIDGFQEVKKRPTLKFNGFPAAFIVPSGNESDFLTTNENQRIYVLKVWIFQEYDQTTADTAYDELMDRVEDVLNAVDLQENPEVSTRTMATGLGSGVTLVAVMATPGQMVPDEEVKLLAAEITVRCKVTIDLTIIT